MANPTTHPVRDEVVRLKLQGLENRDIARRLDISTQRVWKLTRIARELGELPADRMPAT